MTEIAQDFRYIPPEQFETIVALSDAILAHRKLLILAPNLATKLVIKNEIKRLTEQRFTVFNLKI